MNIQEQLKAAVGYKCSVHLTKSFLPFKEKIQMKIFGVLEENHGQFTIRNSDSIVSFGVENVAKINSGLGAKITLK